MSCSDKDPDGELPRDYLAGYIGGRAMYFEYLIVTKHAFTHIDRHAHMHSGVAVVHGV